VAVVGRPGDPDRAALERVARMSSSPGAVVAVGEPDVRTDAEEGDPSVVSLLAGRDLVDGRAAAYVCRGMVCDRPVTTVEELEALLGR
jgi:uncharacterized protein